MRGRAKANHLQHNIMPRRRRASRNQTRHVPASSLLATCQLLLGGMEGLHHLHRTHINNNHSKHRW